MANASRIKNEQELAELLSRCGYVSTPPDESDAWGFWQEECRGHELPLARAIMGDFFFTAEGEAFELFMLDPQDFWFHLVGHLRGEVSEQAVAEMLRDIFDPFDWYHIMYRCREIKHQAGWERFTQDCPEIDTISPEFKKLLFDFLEAQVLQDPLAETWPLSLKELQVSKNLARALRNLLAFLALPKQITPAHYYVMARYFPAQSQPYYYEPPALKPIFSDLQKTFSAQRESIEQHSALMKLIRRLDQTVLELAAELETEPDFRKQRGLHDDNN